MEPEDLTSLGLVTVAAGVALTLFSFLFFTQVYSCILSLGTSCLPDATSRFAWAFPLTIAGGYLIIVGAMVSVGGYIVSNLRTNKVGEEPEDSSPGK